MFKNPNKDLMGTAPSSYDEDDDVEESVYDYLDNDDYSFYY